mmetsp:Transcript_43551/g.79722  ORF Transcript_43551/g.79722 Transcript_43551/m.79722 type:complete len:574 (-) Transcript_43551:92-1813(-)
MHGAPPVTELLKSCLAQAQAQGLHNPMEADISAEVTPAGMADGQVPRPPASPAQADVQEGKTKRCHLHVRLQSNCKICQRHRLSSSSFSKSDNTAPASIGHLQEGYSDILELTNTETFNFNPRLRNQILKSQYFKSLLEMNNPEHVVKDLHCCTHAEPHTDASGIEPSTLFCCLYRLFTLRVTYEELRMLMCDDESPYVRVAAFLYIRYGFRPKDVWHLIQDYLFDTEEFTPSMQGGTTTVGAWLEHLLESDRYFSTVLPRLPQSLKCDIGARIVQLPQLRHKYSENVKSLGWFRPRGRDVEVLVNNTWQRGCTLSVNEDCAHCYRCSVRLHGSNTEIITSLGMVRRSDKGRSAKAKHDKAEEGWETWTDDQNLHQGSNSEASPAAQRSRQNSPSSRGADTKKHARSRSRSPIRRKKESQAGSEVPHDKDEGLDSDAARQQYMRMLRDKATVPNGVRAGCRLNRYKFDMMCYISGYGCGPKTPEKEYTLQRSQSSTDSTKDHASGSRAQKRHEFTNDPYQKERNKSLLRVLEKYGSGGAAKNRRLEYHEAASKKAGQQKSLDLMDTTDHLRLG